MAWQMDEVVSALEEYLTSSTQGEFAERILILNAFKNQRKSQGQCLLSNVIHNLVNFFSQHKLNNPIH